MQHLKFTDLFSKIQNLKDSYRDSYRLTQNSAKGPTTDKRDKFKFWFVQKAEGK